MSQAKDDTNMLDRTFTYTDLSEQSNNNKYWRIIVDDEGNVKTEWGRIGFSSQSKDFGKRGIEFANTKIKEKTDKGYEEQDIIRNGTTVSKTIDFQHISDNPLVQNFVNKIFMSNKHNILTNTTLTYNTNSGLFETPLGIVTPITISKARTILEEMARSIKEPNSDFAQIISKYFQLIPHNIGMKPNLSIWFNLQKIKDESAMLDALQSSYESIISNINPDKGKTLDVEIKHVNNQAEADKIEEQYEKSKSDYHVDRKRYKIINIYKISLPQISTIVDDNIIDVFHGTGEGNLLSILVNGLRISPPSSTYISGKMFGNGIYGAINSTKSIGYTNVGHNQSGWIFICDFIMGKYYVPSRIIDSPPQEYNSVWAKRNSCGLIHDELIVYQNNRAKIKYLLEIK